MKKHSFCQVKLFDSVMNGVHFVKISCSYLESEVQTFGVQNGLCCAGNFSIQESQRWTIFLHSVNDKQVKE